jgi:hypothetical protein
MIPIIAFATVALGFMLFLAFQVWWQSGHGGESGNLSPVDLDAFRNLIDPQELQFLRENLPPKDFRRIQRIRLRAAAAYISVISKNTGQLVAIGRCASAHPDEEIAAAGVDVVQRALRLKLWCFLSLIELNATMVFPTLLAPSSEIANRYLDVSSMTTSLPKQVAA